MVLPVVDSHPGGGLLQLCGQDTCGCGEGYDLAVQSAVWREHAPVVMAMDARRGDEGGKLLKEFPGSHDEGAGTMRVISGHPVDNVAVVGALEAVFCERRAGDKAGSPRNHEIVQDDIGFAGCEYLSRRSSARRSHDSIRIEASNEKQPSWSPWPRLPPRPATRGARSSAGCAFAVFRKASR